MVCSAGDVYKKFLRLYFGYICGDLCLFFPCFNSIFVFLCLVHASDSNINND